MKYSNAILFTRLVPKTGNDPRTSGKTAQCIAQATVVITPAASQLIFAMPAKIMINLVPLQQSCKYEVKTFGGFLLQD